jgi:hypothetical protein
MTAPLACQCGSRWIPDPDRPHSLVHESTTDGPALFGHGVIQADPAEIAEALVIHPGDKLLVRVDAAHAFPDQVDELLDDLRKRFPECGVTIIAAEQLAVIRA